MNDIEFTNLQELRKRINPALESKVKEFQRKDIKYIKESDIFEYLTLNKWSKSNDLNLATIVNDILNTPCNIINDYVLNKLNSKEDKIELPKRKDINE